MSSVVASSGTRQPGQEVAGATAVSTLETIDGRSVADVHADRTGGGILSPGLRRVR